MNGVGDDSRRSPNGTAEQSHAGPLSACCGFSSECAVYGDIRTINVYVDYVLGPIFHRHGYTRLSGSSSDINSEEYGQFHNDPKLTLSKDTIPLTIIFDKSF